LNVPGFCGTTLLSDGKKILFATMSIRFNEELVKAGVMLAGDGLTPTAKAKRVRFSGSQRTIIDGRLQSRRSWSPATGSGR